MTAEVRPGAQSAAQHQAKQRRAKDAQHAAGHGADQPFQAERPHPHLKDNDRAGRPGAHNRTHPSCHAEWMKEKTDPGKKGHKKKTNHNQVHKRPTPHWQGEKSCQTVYSWGVSHLLAAASSGKAGRISEQWSGQ